MSASLRALLLIAFSSARLKFSISVKEAGLFSAINNAHFAERAAFRFFKSAICFDEL
jgi:hypothetical protein